MGRKRKEIEKRMLYTTLYTEEDRQSAIEELEMNNIEVNEYSIDEEMFEIKDSDYLDIKEVFKTMITKGNIIAIADCGRWNGRKHGYKTLDNNLSSIFELLSNYDDYEIYVDDKNLHITGYHHDGTDYVLLRSFKEDITPEKENNFTSFIYTDTGVNNRQIGYYTESIRPLIADYYGF